MGWVLAALVVAIVLVVALVAFSRLRSLGHRVGSFACAVVMTGAPHQPAVQGIAHYAVGRLDWWRRWSLSPRPAHSWPRATLEVESRELLPGSEDTYVVRCTTAGAPLVLTMSVPAYAGLTSWLESAPPSSAGAAS